MNFTSSPSFTLPQSAKKTINEMSNLSKISPGPKYDTSRLGLKQNTISHRFGKSKRKPINDGLQQTPSPQKYIPKITGRQKYHNFGGSQRPVQTNQNPDPAVYQPQQNITKPKLLHYTLSSRYPSIMDQVNKNPGPGEYETISQLPILTKSKSVKQSFGTSSRFKYKVADGPSVGQYQIAKNKLSQFQTSFSIGKAERPQVQQEESPGPSDYQRLFTKNTKSQPKKINIKALKSIIQTKTSLTSQSFGKYFQNPEKALSSLHNSPKYSMGKSKREFTKINSNPAPNEYLHDDLIQNKLSIAFPNSERTEFNDTIDYPGPGTYRVESEKGIQFSFPRSKSVMSISKEIPGVGRYQINSNRDSKGNAFGKSNRPNFISKNVAGVGDYNIVKILELKGSINKAERFQDRIIRNPGPGDYHIRPIIGYTN